MSDSVSLGVSTYQFASFYGLVDYKTVCADPFVFEMGLARVRAEPISFEGGSAHLRNQIVDLEEDARWPVLTPLDREPC